MCQHPWDTAAGGATGKLQLVMRYFPGEGGGVSLSIVSDVNNLLLRGEGPGGILTSCVLNAIAF